ncbi:hypothetical protein [Methylobacterium sp. Leaf112]|jgi:hypothetical protein|nr:hypothetical protein [Methylobacterium sp. Leaf112]
MSRPDPWTTNRPLEGGRVFLTWRAGFPWAERLSLSILEASARPHETAL